jgi:hypothetical protein
VTGNTLKAKSQQRSFALFATKLETCLLLFVCKSSWNKLQTSQTRWGDGNYVVKFFWRDAVEQKSEFCASLVGFSQKIF